jgi:hypothetical protein
VVANQMVHKIPLELAGRVFPTTLIILEGQGIDVILDMNRIELYSTSLLVWFTSTLLFMARFLCSCHLSLVSKHLSMLPLPRVWMRNLWSMSIQMCFPMIYRGCLLIGPLNSRSSCSLVLPPSISDHIRWHQMSWQN